MENLEQNFNIRQAVPFFMVTDMEASLQFYITGLGFMLKNTWTPRGEVEWCWLEREGVALMLQQYRKEDPKSSMPKGGGLSICFQCHDALALYKEFVSKGLSPKEPFVGNNLWDVSITDPDGYHLHFESPTDVPEETNYSEWFKK